MTHIQVDIKQGSLTFGGVTSKSLMLILFVHSVSLWLCLEPDPMKGVIDLMKGVIVLVLGQHFD